MKVIFRNPVTYRTALCRIITAQSTFYRFPVVAFDLNNCGIATRFNSNRYVLLWINTPKLDKLIILHPSFWGRESGFRGSKTGNIVCNVRCTYRVTFYSIKMLLFFLSNSRVLNEVLIIPCVNICSSRYQLPVDLLRGQCLFNHALVSCHVWTIFDNNDVLIEMNFPLYTFRYAIFVTLVT